jgi:hypothetical protein
LSIDKETKHETQGGSVSSKYFFFLIITISNFSIQASNDSELQKRKPYDISLPHLTYLTDSESGSFEVFVAYEGSRDGWGIGTGNDRYVKDSKKMRLDHTYRELPSQAMFISNFEASVLADVCKMLSEVLVDFEKDLKSKRWDKCLFLDAYFPNFLKRFHYLLSAALASEDVLPPVTKINDTLFDCSENSVKSDRRINVWKSDSSKCMKLRIATKEFTYLLNKWRSDVLLNTERDPWENKTEELFSVYELFVQLYFNLPQQRKT